MKAWILVVAAAVALAVAVVMLVPAAPDSPDDPFGTERPDVADVVLPEGTEPSGSVNAFGWGYLDEAGEGNILFSPYGLYVALGMLANGAEPGSPTEEEVLELLGSEDIDSLNAYLDSILDAVGTFGHTRFDSSSMVLVESSTLSDPGSCMDEDFVKAVTRYCDATVSEADFSGNLDQVKRDIARWVDRNTGGMIPDYRSIATEDTLCDLLNVVCFKGKWENDFEPGRTFDEAFHNFDGTETPTPMMHGDFSGIRYYEDGRYRGLELMYDSSRDGGMCMRIVLPSDPTCLNTLNAWSSESSEYRESFMRSLSSGEAVDAVVTIPKFSLSASYDLERVLTAMGLCISFTDDAEYTKIIDGMVLKVDSGKHQAVITVDEEGTEAAAVTEFSMKSMSVGPGYEVPKVVFRCDVPFVFTITDGFSGTDLFMGYVGDSTAFDV